MSASVAWSCSCRRRLRFSAVIATVSRALSSTASSSIASIGFSTNPNAPAFIASTTFGMLPYDVTITTCISGAFCRKSFSRSRSRTSGSIKSSRTT